MFISDLPLCDAFRFLVLVTIAIPLASPIPSDLLLKRLKPRSNCSRSVPSCRLLKILIPILFVAAADAAPAAGCWCILMMLLIAIAAHDSHQDRDRDLPLLGRCVVVVASVAFGLCGSQIVQRFLWILPLMREGTRKWRKRLLSKG